MWESKGKVAVAGVGFSKIARNSDQSLGSLAIEACLAAVEDAGLQTTDIDGLATYPNAPFRGAGNLDGQDVVTATYLIRHLEPTPSIKWYAMTEQGGIPTAVIEATNALIAGACEYALVWRAMHQPKGTYGAVRDTAARGESQFTVPYGMGAGFQSHALTLRRYMERYGATREHLATLVVSQRANANKNEKAFFYNTPMTVEDYMTTRMIANPLCLFDCDIPVEAAGAIVLTTADRAKDLKNPPAYIAGYGQNTIHRPTMIFYVLEDYLENGASLVSKIWERSGLGPKDVDVAELYDGFSPSAMYWIEAAGFCGRGEAFEFMQDGRIELGGELPVNTHGGSLSEGRMHGIGHVVEAVLQVTGRADARQVKDAHVALITEGSPMQKGSGLLFTSEP